MNKRTSSKQGKTIQSKPDKKSAKTKLPARPAKKTRSVNLAPEDRFDIHLHLFNKSFLAKELYFRLIQVIHKLFEKDEDERGLLDIGSKIGSVIQTIKRINHFLHVGFKSDSTGVCDELNEVYQNKFILTPLMFDLTYCFVSSAIKTRGAEKPVDYFALLEKQKKSLLQKINKVAPPAKTRSVESAELDKVLKEFNRLMEKLKRSHEKDNKTKKPGARDLGGIPGEDNGFRVQIEQLEDLKNNPKYQGRIFPFLAVDPRRPGILEYMKQNVGKGKKFIGVKLYCPNGYSPTDPLLYGSDNNDDCVYKFCEDNKIPITAHCSYGGFATFVSSVEITGDIYDSANKKLKHLNKELYNFKYAVLKDFGTAIKERALALNHPQIWEKVLQKYPALYLDLAHFGGGDRLAMALDGTDDKESGNWSAKIMELILKYKNNYTDVSCYSEFETLRKLKGSEIYKKIKGKILYGSDFYLLLLFENDFANNIEQFKTVFANDFDVISRDNPGKFLANVI
jgi:predicted TIM-barrel fold metal-dependent hydrolase